MQKMDRSRVHGHRRRASVSRKKVDVTDYNVGGLDSLSNVSLMEVLFFVRIDSNIVYDKAHIQCIIK